MKNNQIKSRNNNHNNFKISIFIIFYKINLNFLKLDYLIQVSKTKIKNLVSKFQ